MYHRNLRVLVLLTISKSDSSKEALICVNPSGLRDRLQWILRCKNLGQLMSALGQKRTSRLGEATSALPPKADVGTQPRNVRFVPKADINALRPCARH